MKIQTINIILIILLILSIFLNVILLKKTFVKEKEVQKNKIQYQIKTSFIIEYPENDEIKYYDDISEELLSIVKEKSKKIYDEYGIDINDSITIEPWNVTNTSYNITIILEQQEKLISVCKEVINILKSQKSYNVIIIDGPNENGIVKVE